MTLSAAIYGEKFHQLNSEVGQLLKLRSLSNTALHENFTKEMLDFQKRGFLTIAFVGEYSAGKSSIISAITGIKDIKISADIATDKTAEYRWNDIALIDTPGLWTERRDHDAITMDAIARSDLLVYCLTYSLFDTTTLENFKALAFGKNFQSKMLLLVNKMSAEAGDDNDKIINYTSSLKDSLQPYDLMKFPLFFCDARDYIDGITHNDPELIELSRFNTLIDGLNKFTHDKGVLARLDTPLRIMLSYLDQASDTCLGTGSTGESYTHLLTNLRRVTEKNRQALRNEVESIFIDLESQITKLGRSLAQQIGVDENLQSNLQESERVIQKYCEESSSQFQSAIEDAARSLQIELGEEFEKPLMNEYVNYANKKISQLDIGKSNTAAELSNNLNFLKGMANTIGVPIKGSLSMTTAGKATNYTANGLNTAAQVSGSVLHTGIYSAGKLIGYNFKPWQAVNIAKGVGNALAVVGVVLSIASLFMDVVNESEAASNETKISDAKRDLNNEFQNVARSIVREFRNALQQIESDLYGQIDKKVSDERIKQEIKASDSNETINAVVATRESINRLLIEINS